MMPCPFDFQPRERPKWNLVTGPFISFPRPVVNRILERFEKSHFTGARRKISGLYRASEKAG
jgi:hypothetical protein